MANVAARRRDLGYDPETQYRPEELSDHQAELACLSGMFDPTSLAEVVEELEPGDFYRPAHQVIARLMIEMWAQQLHLDQVTLWDYMVKAGETRCIDDNRMYLHDLWSYPAAKAGAAYHARIIREFSVRRKLDQAGLRIQQRASWRDSSAAEMIDLLETQLQEIRLLAEAQPGVDGLMTVAEFAARDLIRAQPVIPGLLDAMDRVILVAKPGTGKTHLALQVAFMTAAGLHPFIYGAPIPPKRVLILDLENPAGILQRRLKSFRRVAKSVPTFDESNLMIFHQPGGLDLRDKSQAQRLTSVIRQAKPDLIVGGPIYKMLIDQGEGAEHLHSGITAYWDRIRAMFGPALWLETHPPMGAKELRPTGSGIYTRWPEFGITMERHAKDQGVWTIGRFRDDREEGRTFPTEVTRSAGFGEVWPFTGRYADGIPADPLDMAPEVISQ